MPALITVIGGADALYEQVGQLALDSITRAAHVYYAPNARPSLLSRLGRPDLEPLDHAADAPLPEALVERAAGGEHVAWLVSGDPADRGLDAQAIAALAQRGVTLEVLEPAGGLRRGPQRPLEGRVVLVTRPPHQAAETCMQLARLGAEPLCMPTVEIAFERDLGPLQAAIGERPELLVVTSANGATALERALTAAKLDARVFAETTVCAIGPGTARALARVGLRADLVARDHVAEGLLAELPAERVAGARVLIPRAAVAREVLPETLVARGAAVDVVPVYTARMPSAAHVRHGVAALRAGAVHAVTFTSASTVRHFCELLGDELDALTAELTVVAIGPVTAAACDELGLTVHVQPASFTIPAMIQALVARVAGADGP